MKERSKARDDVIDDSWFQVEIGMFLLFRAPFVGFRTRGTKGRTQSADKPSKKRGLPNGGRPQKSRS